LGQPCPRQQRQPSELASAGPEAASFDAAAAVAVEECEGVAGEPVAAAVGSGCVPSVCPEISCLLLTLGYRSHRPHEEGVDVEQLDQAAVAEYCYWPAALELRGPLPSAVVGSTVSDQNPACLPPFSS